MTTTKFTVESNEFGKKNGASLLTNSSGKDNMSRQCKVLMIWPLILLIALKLLAICYAQTVPSISVSADRVSLNAILKHQQALVEECLRLEREKTFELRQQLLEAEQQQDDSQQHEPITLKLPAVCLLLNGPPTLKTLTVQSDPTPKSADTTHPLRLDLVNWLYEYDDLLDELHHVGDKATNNKTKRHIDGAAKSSKKGSKIYMADNEIDSPEQREAEQIFQSQLQQMIADDRFQQALHLNQDKIGAHLSPVILVPGLAGSRLQARVSKVNRVNIICKKQHDWQEMWLSLRSFLPIAIDCWIDNVRLEYDLATGFAREPAGVETRAPSFGSVESVRHLDLKSPSLTKYFDAIIENYLKIGYQVDRNLFAAPYDFRLAPQQIEESFFKPLRQLIDEVATGEGDSDSADLLATNRLEQTPSRKITLVCHSMGCTHLLVFLRQQSSSWRQKRVRKVVALSSPWGGAAKALKALVVGEQFGLPLVGDQKMRELVRTFPSVAYLLPQADVFSRPSGRQADFGGPVLVQTPEQNYRVGQIERLLHEIGLDQHWKWFTETTSLIKPLEPPDDAQLDCLHGSNVDTPETIIFRNQTDFPDGDYELVNGDGDGTVNDQSLLVCSEWARRLPHMIRHRVVPNTSHSGLLTDKQVLDYLTEDAATN